MFGSVFAVIMSDRQGIMGDWNLLKFEAKGLFKNFDFEVRVIKSILLYYSDIFFRAFT